MSKTQDSILTELGTQEMFANWKDEELMPSFASRDPARCCLV